MMQPLIRSLSIGILILASTVQSGTYLSPSSGFFVAPLTLQETSTQQGYLKSIFYDIPDILKCLPRFIAGKISSGTESIVLSMTQPVNYVTNEKLTSESFLKCLGGAGLSDSDAAENFIRKLGNKIIKEEDWRVSGKSLFIMHQMLTSPAISIDVVRELAESYLDRYDVLVGAVQLRISRSQGDNQALLWVQQYLEYVRSLSEVVRRRSGGREVLDFRSLLRLSSAYCSSAARLLDISSTAASADASNLSLSSRAFFLQLSGSINALVRSDVKAHSGSLASLQTLSTASYSLQQESFSEIQRHAKGIREAVTKVLGSASPVFVNSSVRLYRSTMSSSSSGIRRGDSLKVSKIETSSDSKICWLESLAEMQCEIISVASPSPVDDSSRSNVNVDQSSQYSESAPISSRKRSRVAISA